MAKYHMKANGQPALCIATNRACPLGADAIHGSSPEEARRLFEAAMQKQVLPSKASRRSTQPKDLVSDPYEGNTVSWAEPYWEWDAHQSGCAEELDGGSCSDSYACHHQTYLGVYLTESDVRGQLTGALGLQSFPDELERAVDWRRPEELFVVERTPDYYGDRVNVRLRRTVEEQVLAYHYSRPNVTDHNGGLEFARVNGLDTSGLTEVEAVRALVSKTLTKELQGKVTSADRVAAQNIPLAKLRFNKSKLQVTSAAAIPMNSRQKNNLGGVVVSNGDGTYTLVSEDYSRFKTVAEAGRKGWPFLVLSATPKSERGWGRGPQKEPLSSPAIDTTDW